MQRYRNSVRAEQVCGMLKQRLFILRTRSMNNLWLKQTKITETLHAEMTKLGEEVATINSDLYIIQSIRMINSE